MPGKPNVVIDPAALPVRVGSDYPAPHDQPVAARQRRALGDAAGLSQFGVNLMHLPPGCASSQRHWHRREEELVYVLEGEVVLVTDAGEQVLTAGMAAGFPAGNGDGHHLVNRGPATAVLLEVGSRIDDDEVDYSDVDMRVALVDGRQRFVRRDGTPY